MAQPPPPPLTPDDLTLLRLHAAAGWGLRVPPLTPGEASVARDPTLPLDDETRWDVFVAATARGEVRLWNAAVPASERPALLARVAAAHALPPDAPLPQGVTREVVLGLRAAPRLTPAQARRVARQLTPRDSPLFERLERDSSAYYTDPRRAPVFGVVRAGQLLAVAHSSRRTPHACELGVETLPEARRHGYALAVTIRWAATVAAAGLVPLYSALATNQASLALAAAAGYLPVAHAAYITPATPRTPLAQPATRPR
jgi:RimJ/RimL family protein N-acetyltransferase